MLMRLRMIAKLSRILGKDVAPTKGRPRLIDTRAKPAMQNRKLKLLRKMRTALGKKSKPKKPKKKLKDSKYWRTFAEKKPMKAVVFRMMEEDEEEEDKTINEPEVQITLTSAFVTVTEELIYDFNTGHYEQVVLKNPLLNLLYLPSKIRMKDVTAEGSLQGEGEGEMDDEEKEDEEEDDFYREFRKPPPTPEPPSEDSDLEELLVDSRRELEELYHGQISKEELARIDAQPNPFNFSDRVSQCTKISHKSVGMQTAPPPATKFVVNVSPFEIYQGYQKYQAETLKKEKKKKEEVVVERERASGGKPLDDFVLIAPKSKKPKLGQFCFDLGSLRTAATVVERMVTQNIFDDILQDFKYWEDGSDEYKPMDGSLLPLWRFKFENTKSLIVSDICWSPAFPDLFAAAYISGEVGGDDGPGLLCVYNLKNTVSPERVFHAPCGINTVEFHPQIPGLMAGGWSDGTIAVYDVDAPLSSAIATSSTMNGKHILPVTQVRWQRSLPGEEQKFFSISLDGRVTRWHFQASKLKYVELLNFRQPKAKKYSGLAATVALEGSPTCIAVCPEDEEILLLGVDTGAVFQCNTISMSHSLTRYPAHLAPVRDVAWNTYHFKVFLTCSLDWTVKVWFKNNLSPLVVLDMGGAAVGVTWSPYSSSVIVAVTEECRISVHDLFTRLCRPLCTQSILQKRKILGSCVAFSPYYPIILVGGSKGHLVSMKLSPNLRKIHKDAKGADAARLREIELSKIERLIATIQR